MLSQSDIPWPRKLEIKFVMQLKLLRISTVGARGSEVG
jgi:hypothetical protein